MKSPTNEEQLDELLSRPTPVASDDHNSPLG